MRANSRGPVRLDRKRARARERERELFSVLKNELQADRRWRYAGWSEWWHLRVVVLCLCPSLLQCRGTLPNIPKNGWLWLLGFGLFVCLFVLVCPLRKNDCIKLYLTTVPCIACHFKLVKKKFAQKICKLLIDLVPQTGASSCSCSLRRCSTTTWRLCRDRHC